MTADMLVDAYSAPGDEAKPNEDWWGAAGQIAVLLDGVTTPPGMGTGCIHGVVWYVNQLGSALLQESSLPLDDHLSRAITAVAARHSNLCDLAHPGTPSSTVAMVRVGGGAIEYLLLSDSTLILELRDGPTIITDHSVDAVAKSERTEVARHALGTEDHAEAVRALVFAQWRSRNTEGGYWLAAADAHAASHSVVGRVTATRGILPSRHV
jgi:hypothetical protein